MERLPKQNHSFKRDLLIIIYVPRLEHNKCLVSPSKSGFPIAIIEIARLVVSSLKTQFSRWLLAQ